MLWGLPDNYDKLSEDDRRQARIMACAQQDSPDDVVRAWALFRALYLFPAEGRGSLYKHKRYPSPQAHYQWVRDFAEYNFNAIAAPRASAKSVVLGKELPLMLAITKPGTIVALLLASDKKVEERVSELMQAIDGNPFLANDYGKLKPARGQDIWNRHQLTLLNGSIIVGLSIDSRKLGLRPHVIILDDPEYNPDKPEQETQLLRDLDTLIFNELLPMLEDDGKFMWIGTMLNRRAALWHVCTGDLPQFTYWNRRVYSMIAVDADGKRSYFWRSKWSPKVVARKRRILGPVAFEAQCQNNPVSREARILNLHESLDWWETAGDKARWFESVGTTIAAFEKPWQQWLDGLARVFMVDPASRTRSVNDPSAIVCVGIDSERAWWVLDAFEGRVTDTALIAQLYVMGLKWQPVLIGVENVGFQDILRQHIDEGLDEKTAGSGWKPRVWPIAYPSKLSKASRIEALAGRFGRHTIKLPRHLRGGGAIKMLVEQIENFTPDLALLPHDDLVDCLAMVPYCPRVGPTGIVQYVVDYSIAGQLAAGRVTDLATGLPIGLCVDPRTIDPALVDRIRADRHSRIASERRAAEHRTAQATRDRLGSVFNSTSGRGCGTIPKSRIDRSGSARRVITSAPEN